jgi:hypothetical protein
VLILLVIATYFTGEMEAEHDEEEFGNVCFHSPNKDSRYGNSVFAACTYTQH